LDTALYKNFYFLPFNNWWHIPVLE